MIKEVIKLLIAFGLFCLLISILFRFYAGLYVVPLINVTPDAALRFTNTIFLIAISLGVYELVKTKRE
jgi:hypothetical protein